MSHRIVFLIYPDFQLLDIAGPLTAFEIAERMRPKSYAWRIVAASAGAVKASSGVAWAAQALPRVDAFDTLVVSGGDGVNAAFADTKILNWVRRVARGTARITSVCSGSMLLAAAGVLDGKTATTHWYRTREFQQRFPQVKLDADRIFVNDGRFWTSAGICAGIDLALALIANDLGDAVARRVAKQLVVYYRRPGGQSQFSALLDMAPAQGRFAQLFDHVRANLAESHSVTNLAERMCMSPRHFARTFLAETGTTPAHAIERLRVETARAALESGAGSIQRVAQSCGFGNAERMRRSFIRLLGIPPSALKSRA
ncbi:MAG: AraC family transcriptional regulator [Rhodocyclales bacterium]|nr:AraC family transcriptional regulator [Rhodocyclales bacterium]